MKQLNPERTVFMGLNLKFCCWRVPTATMILHRNKLEVGASLRRRLCMEFLTQASSGEWPPHNNEDIPGAVAGPGRFSFNNILRDKLFLEYGTNKGIHF